MDSSPPSSSIHGILQASILEWAAISPSKGSSQPRDQTQVSWVLCIGWQILYHRATGEALSIIYFLYIFSLTVFLEKLMNYSRKIHSYQISSSVQLNYADIWFSFDGWGVLIQSCLHNSMDCSTWVFLWFKMPSSVVVILCIIQEEAHCTLNMDMSVVSARGRVFYAKCRSHELELWSLAECLNCLHHLFAVWLKVTSLTSLNHSFFIHKIKIMIVPTS